MKKMVTSAGLSSSYLLLAAVVGGYLLYRSSTYWDTHPVWAAALMLFAGVTIVLNVYSFYRELPYVVAEVRRVRRERREKD